MKRQVKLSSEDIDELHHKNAVLSNTVKELRLEMGYYKSETKRLEQEKKILAQEASNSHAALETAVRHPKAKILHDPEYLHSLVHFPSKSIAEVLQPKDIPVFLTSAQPPYFMEYSNRAWAESCGWETHHAIGLTMAFLQGPMTDSRTTSRFVQDIKDFGYGHMRVVNYRRSGEMYLCTVQAFPVFDSIRPDGPDCDVPVLTHFACVLSAIEEIAQDASAFFKGADRRLQSKRFEKKCRMQPESFLRFATCIRLSDLLRFVMCCEDAMVLTDATGRVVHVNRAWSSLTGYALSEIEGMPSSFLHGPNTNTEETLRCSRLSRAGQPSEMVVTNYRKDRSEFVNRVMMVPIHGGYRTTSVTHFCALLLCIA